MVEGFGAEKRVILTIHWIIIVLCCKNRVKSSLGMLGDHLCLFCNACQISSSSC